MPKISLIMPVYNAEKTLDYSINSVLNQTENDLEFIVVDDGSSDNSLKKLEELKRQSKLKFQIHSKQNGGAASARKYGLDKASGEIIGFIDSDDCIDKDYIKRMHDTLELTKTNICSSRMAIHLGSNILKKFPLKNRRRGLKYDTLEHKEIVPIMNVVTNGKLYRRPYIDITTKNFSANEDLSMNYYLYANAREVSFANDVTYHYIPNSEGLVSKKIFGYTWDKIKNTLIPLSELKLIFEKENLFQEYYSEIEQIFIKNIFDRINYIDTNLQDCKTKTILINTLYDFISYHFPNWQENKYLLSYFKDFELNDIISLLQNKSKVSKYVQTIYESEEDIFNKYEITSNKVLGLNKSKNLW